MATCRAYLAAFHAHDPATEVIYASKAYFGLAMLHLALEEGLLVDVASGGELAAALRAGYPAGHVLMHGNNKDEAELREAAAAGVGVVVVDSLAEIHHPDPVAAEARGRQPVLVRAPPRLHPPPHTSLPTR